MHEVAKNIRAKVLLVGPFPPPFGGISTTVRDLYRRLRAEEGFKVTVLNIGERRREPSSDYLSPRGGAHFVWLLLRHAVGGYVMHLETNGHNLKSWLTAFLCSVCGVVNGNRTIIAFGSGMLPDYIRGGNPLVRALVKMTGRCAGLIICRNEEMVSALQARGCPWHKIHVLPGFVGIKGRRTQSAPVEVMDFVEGHDPVLGAMVAMSPEYGIPLALQAVAVLREHYPNIGLILMGISQADGGTMEDVPAVRPHVLFAGELPPDVALGVMEKVTIFLRPTYCDGDSVSVREALALGVPVVASAVGTRPSSVKTFEVGNLDDLCRKVQQVLTEVASDHHSVRNVEENQGSGDALLGLYESLLGGSARSLKCLHGY